MYSASVAFELWAFALLALGLGIKHAFDVDHVVAVSSLLTRRQRLLGAVGLGTSWASGHMITAGIVSALVFFFADTFLPSIAAKMELLVPFMLVVIGTVGLAVAYRKFHAHRHAHEEGEHRHLHVHTKPSHEHGAMAGIGFVHGLASNDELLVVLLVGVAASAWWQVLVGVALFSVGVMVGMAAYSMAVHAVSRRTGVPWVPEAANALFSVASIGYAVYLFAGGEGLNLLEGFR